MEPRPRDEKQIVRSAVRAGVLIAGSALVGACAAAPIEQTANPPVLTSPLVHSFTGTRYPAELSSNRLRCDRGAPRFCYGFGIPESQLQPLP